jgi:hypothetical protein
MTVHKPGEARYLQIQSCRDTKSITWRFSSGITALHAPNRSTDTLNLL